MGLLGQDMATGLDNYFERWMEQKCLRDFSQRDSIGGKPQTPGRAAAAAIKGCGRALFGSVTILTFAVTSNVHQMARRLSHFIAGRSLGFLSGCMINNKLVHLAANSLT